MDKFKFLKELLRCDRSIRRFDNTRRISRTTLENIISLTRYCASGRNLQPLRYKLITDAKDCSRLFPALAWAGYYQDWAGPSENERPTAYIIQTLDTELTNNPLCDDGLNLQAITLGATALGLGACIIKSFNLEMIRTVAEIPDRYRPLYIVALGYPTEHVCLKEMSPDGDYKYWRDENDNQCVPKRSIKDLIL